MEIEGSKGKMVNSTLEEQIENIFDELEAKIKVLLSNLQGFVF